MKAIHEGPRNKFGEELSGEWPWDAGIGGMLNGKLSEAWRIWYFGSHDQASSNAIMFSLVSGQIHMLFETPPMIMDVAQSKEMMLSYDYASKSPDAAVNFPASGIYTDAPGLNQSSIHRTDLKAFRDRGGKFLAWHGASDVAAPPSSSLKWWRNMGAATGDVNSFSQYYLVPGMGHCSGGPSTDRFDMLTPVMNWVEQGVAPTEVIASASNPGFFNVASRSRPVCPYPKAAIYKGSGDINVPESFVCG
jgi:feruloyl esterase